MVSPRSKVPESERSDELAYHFSRFREEIVGAEATFQSPYGETSICYADWTASGRMYRPIERHLTEFFGPFVANTHSQSSVTGTAMTLAYEQAHTRIKQHVNAGPSDVIVTPGSGMTAAINKFQRILGLRVPEQLRGYIQLQPSQRPVVFLTHMEHHSNQTSWLETIADVVVMDPDEAGLVDPQLLEPLLQQYRNRPLKIGSFTACSNVTGIRTPYYELARIMHRHGGYCFVDFAASAPYDEIDMHPADPAAKLDAVFFSPHKFLGGPGSSGVLVFDSELYTIDVPDHPGGGTVDWTNPWGQHRFVKDIEAREDGGTPGFLQAIRSALAIDLKENMGTAEIHTRERELTAILLEGLRSIPDVHLLAPEAVDRLGIVSFYVEDLHYNLIVRLLNDRFGIQTRGGCSCAGTYGHYLLHVDPTRSKRITDSIDRGDNSEKPGWVRASIHPTLSEDDVEFIVEGVKEIVKNRETWAADYRYSPTRNEFTNIYQPSGPDVSDWLRL